MILWATSCLGFWHPKNRDVSWDDLSLSWWNLCFLMEFLGGLYLGAPRIQGKMPMGLFLLPLRRQRFHLFQGMTCWVLNDPKKCSDLSKHRRISPLHVTTFSFSRGILLTFPTNLALKAKWHYPETCIFGVFKFLSHKSIFAEWIALPLVHSSLTHW